MGVRGEELRREELETAIIQNFFEEFCYKGKERNGGRGKLEKEGASREFLFCFYDERMPIWYWEREGEIHDAGERGGLPLTE